MNPVNLVEDLDTLYGRVNGCSDARCLVCQDTKARYERIQSALPRDSSREAGKDAWGGYQERCEHGIRWENRCHKCAAGQNAAAQMPLAKSAGAIAAVNGTDKPGEVGVTSGAAAPADDRIRDDAERYRLLRSRCRALFDAANLAEPQLIYAKRFIPNAVEWETRLDAAVDMAAKAPQ